MRESEQKEPYTWAKLKEFCNGLTEEQLQLKVCVIGEDDSSSILEAAELGLDLYKFEDEDYAVSIADFDPETHLEGKYESFDDAIQYEEFTIVPSNTVFLWEDF